MTRNSFPSAARDRGLNGLRRRFGIDTRSLAAFRIALGALLLADLLLRSRDLVAFYTDFGVLPRAALVSTFSSLHGLSVHAVSGEAWVQAVLFLLAGGFAAALLVGYRTPLATVASWLLLLSLQSRNPLVLNSGDTLLNALLLWGIFLPLGERWSVDSLRSDRRRPRVVGVATAALLLQVVLVYSTNAAFKLSGDLWRRGEAIHYVFSLDQFTVLLGDVIAAYPTLLSVLGHVWFGMLLLSPLLILLTNALRGGFALLFVGMHLGMLLTMQLGLFPLISAAGLLPFLPGAVWEVLPSPPVRYLETAFVRWRATLGAAGSATTSRTAPSGPDGLRRVATTLLPAVLLALVVLSNVQSLGYDVVPDGADPALEPTPIDQRWSMFAPDPLRTDVWYVVPGRLRNGSRVDALHRSRVRWDRPPDIASAYPNARWRKYLSSLRRRDSEHRSQFGDYLCRRWNDQRRTELVDVTIYAMEEPSRPFADAEPVERVELRRHRCPGVGGANSS